MSLVGSGMNHIQNFVSKTSLAAADFDQSFAAIVEQVGGIYWAAGAPAVYAGNLTRADNFAASMSIPRSVVLERRSMSVVVSNLGYTNSTVREHFLRVDKAARLEWLSVNYSTVTPGAGVAVTVWANGVVLTTGAFSGSSTDLVVDAGKDVSDQTLLRVDCLEPVSGTVTVTAYLTRDHTS